MSQRYILIGAGGHAKVLADLLRARDAEVLGVVDPAIDDAMHLGFPVLGGDDAVLKYAPDSVSLALGVGSVPGNTAARVRLYDDFRARGYRFEPLVHPSALIAADVTLADGAQVMAGCVLQPSVRIGENSIVNTRASIDHDCVIGKHVHVAPGVTLSGSVVVENGVHLGTGAAVIDRVTIGRGAIVGAGATVFKNIPPGATVRSHCEIFP